MTLSEKVLERVGVEASNTIIDEVSSNLKPQESILSIESRDEITWILH